MEVIYSNNYLYIFPLILLCVVKICMTLIPANKSGNNRMRLLADIIFCICIALAIGTFLRQYPWTSLPTRTDSSVFLYIGKQMHAGKVPYVDLFDHKGPLLYLIQYLGFSIWKDSVAGGVWILELVSFGGLGFLMLKLSEYVSKNHENGYLAVVLILIVCALRLYQGGNYTEEYAMFWIATASLVFYSFFKTGTYRKRSIVILGLSCMAVLLLQWNLVTVWVAFIPVVLFVLIREKRYKEIWQCIVLFLLGMMIILLPILLWAIKKGFLKEMWQCYVLFNISYSEVSAPDLLGYLKLTEKTLLRLWPCVLTALVALICNRKDKLQWMNCWFFVVSLILMQINGRESLYYLLVMLPTFVLPATSFFKLLQFRKTDRNDCQHPIIVITACLVLVCALVGFRAVSLTRVHDDDGVVAFLKENTDPDDDVLIIGNYAWPYVAADRSTDNRFFFQWPPVQVSDELYDMFIDEIGRHPSDVVVLPEHENAMLGIPKSKKITTIIKLLEDSEYQSEKFDKFRVWTAP